MISRAKQRGSRHLFEPVRPARVVDVIFSQIVDRVSDGTLAPGERLPTERELAAQLRVSRSTVRETLRMLERLGVVEIRPGARGGAFVAAASFTPVGKTLSLMLQLGRVSSVELLESRLFIEQATAWLAASRATAGHLERIRQTIDDMAENLSDRERLVRSNSEFHLAVADAAQNPVLKLMLWAVIDLVNRSLAEQSRAFAVAETILTAHRQIYAAIAAGAAETARDRMSEHLQAALERAHIRIGRGDGRPNETSPSPQ